MNIMYKIFDSCRFALRRIIKACKLYCVLSLLSTFFSAITAYSLVLISRELINRITEGVQINSVAVLLILQAGIYICLSLLNSFLSYLVAPTSAQKLHTVMQMDIFNKILTFSLSVFDNTNFYEKLNIAAHSADSKVIECFNILLSTLRNLLEVILMVSIIISLEPVLLLIITLPVISGIFLNFKKNKYAYEFELEKNKCSRKRGYVSRIYYLKDYAREVHTTSVYEVLNKKYLSFTDELISTAKKYGGLFFAVDNFQSIIQNAATFAMTFILCKRALSGEILIGDYMAALSSAGKITIAAESLFTSFTKLYENSLYTNDYRNFMKMSLDDDLNKHATTLIAKPNNMLVISEISYTYGGRHSPAVNNVSLHIHQGEIIGIVGRNGAGKSTLIELIAGLLIPNSGYIFAPLSPDCFSTDKHWRENVCAIFQKSNIFAISIAENILMRRVNCYNDYEKVKAALVLVGLWDKVNSLPDKMDTEISFELEENGTYFSGGEIQKILLARILVSDAKIFILDEALVSLDKIAEKELWDALKEKIKTGFAFVVTHDFNNVSQFDNILVLDSGQAVAFDKHEELLEKCTIYRSLFYQQEKATD